MENYSCPIKYCENKKRLVATRFLHKSTKPLNLLQLIPSQLSLEDLHDVLRPKLGQRVQAVEEQAFQLRLLVNIKPGGEILASTTFTFNLPSVVIMETTSSTFAKHLLNNPVTHMGKYLQQTSNLYQLCDAILLSHKHQPVLRLRVTSSDINLIRRLWPFLWTNWKSVVLWSHEKEHNHHHPPIRKIKVPFFMEVERMLRKCQFDESEDAKVLALRELAARVHLLFQSIDIPNTRKMSVKRLAKAIVIDANTSSSLPLISRVCGLSKLRQLSKTILREVGFITNQLKQTMFLEDYVRMRTMASFTFSEAEVAFTKRTESAVWIILKQVEAFGLITCGEVKRSTKRVVSPTMPSCLRETLTALFTAGEMECMETFKAFSENEQTRQQILAYMSHVSKSSGMRNLQLCTSDVRVSCFFELFPDSWQEPHSRNFENVQFTNPTDGLPDPNATEILPDLNETEILNVSEMPLDLNSTEILKDQAGSEDSENESSDRMIYVGKANELHVGLAEKYDTRRPNTNVESTDQVSHNGTCDEIKTNNSNSFDCKICQTGFARKISLKNHMQIHSVNSVNKQPLNKKGSSVKSILVTHTCTICTKRFAKKSNMKRHMQIHTRAETFECVFCKTTLARQDQLILHLTKHVKENRYACKLCFAEFSENRMLKNHMLSHNGSDLKCKKCNNCFPTRIKLLQHIKCKHKSSRPYSCTFCSKLFQSHDNLRNHMRVHTKEKPFECRTCKKEFNAPSLVIQHKKLHCNKN